MTKKSLKLLMLSDLHLEFADFEPPHSGYDVAILAGDIHTGVDVLEPSKSNGEVWVKNRFHKKPVLYIPGNHEFYNDNTHAEHHPGQTQVLHVGNFTIIGATLWTDFLLYGHAREADALSSAARGMTDFSCIWHGERRFTPKDSAFLHRNHVFHIEQELQSAQNRGSTAIVVTHHAPSPQSITPYWKKHGGLLNAAFASDLRFLMEKYRPPLWVHGHMHNSLDYRHKGTRVVCNPRGYVPRSVNPNFNPKLVVEVKHAVV